MSKRKIIFVKLDLRMPLAWIIHSTNTFRVFYVSLLSLVSASYTFYGFLSPRLKVFFTKLEDEKSIIQMLFHLS